MNEFRLHVLKLLEVFHPAMSHNYFRCTVIARNLTTTIASLGITIGCIILKSLDTQ